MLRFIIYELVNLRPPFGHRDLLRAGDGSGGNASGLHSVRIPDDTSTVLAAGFRDSLSPPRRMPG
jgi:hypothetical protein